MNRFETLKEGISLAKVKADLHALARHGETELPEKRVLEPLRLLGVALRPRAGGTFMMRIRATGGRLTAAQAMEVGRIARAFGRDRIDITARAQLQIRWLRLDQVPQVIDRLEAVGLLTCQTLMDSVRNIITCPLAGLSDHELFDVEPVLADIDRRLIGRDDFVDLPRKVNMAVSSCQRHCCGAQLQDVALTPAWCHAGRGGAGFNVWVGGKASTNDFRVAKALDMFIEPSAAAEVLAGLLSIYRDHGPREQRSRARLAWLVDAWGTRRLRVELERRLGRALAPAGVDARSGQSCALTGVLPQRQPGRSAVGLVVPVGRLSGGQLIRLSELATQYGGDELRLTCEQNIIVPHIADRHVSIVLREPVITALNPEAPAAVRGTKSCIGAEFCSLAVIETKQRALDVARELDRRLPGLGPLRIHWSGCNAGCGQHLSADIGLQGRKVERGGEKVDAVDIYLGGSPGPDPKPAVKCREAVPCDDLVDTLVALLRDHPELVGRCREVASA